MTAGRVTKALRGKQMLLLLDNCEHLIDAAAATAEALPRAIPSANIIATNREPLGAEEEHIYPVPALAVPEADGDHAADPLEYGAVRLFVERARAESVTRMPDESRCGIIWAAGSTSWGTRSSNASTVTSKRGSAPPDWRPYTIFCSCYQFDRRRSENAPSACPWLRPIYIVIHQSIDFAS